MGSSNRRKPNSLSFGIAFLAMQRGWQHQSWVAPQVIPVPEQGAFFVFYGIVFSRVIFKFKYKTNEEIKNEQVQRL